MANRVFYSRRCQNCLQFIKAIDRIGEAALQVERIDVDVTPVQGVTHVPTLVTETGKVLVGSKAFEFLVEYEKNVPLESYCCEPYIPGALGWTDLTNDEVHYPTPYATF